jgi:hypothetical protein
LNLQRVLFPIITLLLILGWSEYWFTFGQSLISFTFLGIMLAANIISILLMVRMVRLSDSSVSPRQVRIAQVIYSVILALLPGLMFVIAYAGQIDMLYPLIASYVLLALALAVISRLSKKKTRQNTIPSSRTTTNRGTLGITLTLYNHHPN